MPSHIVICALEQSIYRKDFDCGNDALNLYIQQFAGQDAKRKISAVYTASIGKKLIGFYSLSATAIKASEMPSNIAKKLPKYPVPAAIIGRLAIDKSHQNKGLGGVLLIDAIKRIIRSGELIGINSIIVDAKDETAQKFYEHFGFQPMQSKPLRLFLTIHTAINLFSH